MPSAVRPATFQDLTMLLGDKDVLIFCLQRRVEELEAALSVAQAAQAPPEGLETPNEGEAR